MEREKANDESSDRFREIDSTKEEERNRQCTAVNVYVCIYKRKTDTEEEQKRKDVSQENDW